MKILNWELTKKRDVEGTPTSAYNYKPAISKNSGVARLLEAFKGKVKRDEIRIPEDLGEEHLFNLTVAEGLYRQFGMVTGVVDKYVDFIVGPGFFIETDNDKAKQIIETFMRDNNFDSLLRIWVKEALIKGTGFLEMAGNKDEEPTDFKVLDAKWMYIKRDEYGQVENYNQLKIESRGKDSVKVRDEDFTTFDPFEIATIKVNHVGDDAYGMGLVYPAEKMLDKLFSLQSDMCRLMHRKATAPIHAKLGNNEFMPNPADVTAFGQELENLDNRQEWATDWLVDIKVLDFGNVGEKFEIPLKHVEDMLFFTWQVPEVLMGRGNIPEGLANVQLEAFQRRIQSMQADIEKVIETKIFKRILNANGLDAHVEFQWGQPSDKEKNERMTKITEILKNPVLDMNLRSMLEMELAKLLGLNEKELETNQEEIDREENVPLPIIPGQNRKEKFCYEDSVMAIGE